MLLTDLLVMSSNIQIVEKKGALPGKIVLLLAGIHGNETCGVKAFDKLISTINVEKGTVIFCYANLKAIKQNKRFIETNLNRCFLDEQPNHVMNTIEGRTAKEIMLLMNKADILLDIHASNSPESTPFIIAEPESWEYAHIIPFNIITYNWDEYEKGATEAYMHNKGKNAIAIECGYVNNPQGHAIAEQAIINVLTKAGNVKEERCKNQEVRIKKQELYKIVGLHVNEHAPFKKEKEFADFEYLSKKTVIGHEGTTPVYAEEGHYILFVRDREQLHQECFLMMRKEKEQK